MLNLPYQFRRKVPLNLRSICLTFADDIQQKALRESGAT